MGKKAVVLIDEAQMLNTKDLMEEFRGLLNLEVTAHKLISFIFFGLPEIEENLCLDPALLQRVAMKIRLSTLTEEATKAYVVHRLAVAGNRETIFSDDALKLIYGYSGGFPRKINVLCDNALFQGFLMRQRIVDESIVREMASDLGFDKKQDDQTDIPSIDIPATWAPGDALPEKGAPELSPEPSPPLSGVSPEEPHAIGNSIETSQPDPGAEEVKVSTGDDLDDRLEEFFENTFREN
jgi:hypothetical protein